MSNRILDYQATIQGRLDTLPAAKVQAANESMAITPSEHFEYQRMQSQAFALGVITLDEAQTVYRALGETCNPSKNGGWKAHVNCALKVTITKFIGELAGPLVKKLAHSMKEASK